MLARPTGSPSSIPLGELERVEEIAELDQAEPRFPNYIWLANRAWLLAADIDFDSTLIGGSLDLIEAILEEDHLEARQVQSTDSLAWDTDKINEVPVQDE